MITSIYARDNIVLTDRFVMYITQIYARKDIHKYQFSGKIAYTKPLK